MALAKEKKNEKITLVEYELIEDIKELVQTHPDVEAPSLEVQKKIDGIKGGALV